MGSASFARSPGESPPPHSPPPILPAINQPSLLQDVEVFGHGRLGEVKKLGDLGGSQLLLAEGEQHPDAGGIGQRPGDIHERAHA